MATNVDYTIGLTEVKFGVAAPDGTMPTATSLTKVGKVYRDTANISQSAADVTEHYEEGVAVPLVRSKKKSVPVVTLSLVVDDLKILKDTIGGDLVSTDQGWSFDGDDTPDDRSVLIVTKQGLNIEIPNADIDANINHQLSEGGIFLVEVTITPKAVSAGGAFRYVKKSA